MIAYGYPMELFGSINGVPPYCEWLPQPQGGLVVQDPTMTVTQPNKLQAPSAAISSIRMVSWDGGYLWILPFDRFLIGCAAGAAAGIELAVPITWATTLEPCLGMDPLVKL